MTSVKRSVSLSARATGTPPARIRQIMMVQVVVFAACDLCTAPAVFVDCKLYEDGMGVNLLHVIVTCKMQSSTPIYLHIILSWMSNNIGAPSLVSVAQHHFLMEDPPGTDTIVVPADGGVEWYHPCPNWTSRLGSRYQNA